jgi:hypothetical protein
MNDGHYFTYKEWLEFTVQKIVTNGLNTQEEDRADYLTCQIELAISQALRHGRSGRSDDDPVAP